MILINILPLRRSWAENAQTGYHGDLIKIKQVKLLKSIQVYDKW